MTGEREQERRRLARRLEEGPGQSLSLLLAQASAYQAALPPEAAQARQALHTLIGMTQGG
ncbi:MAG TPA: hypothetical protein ENN99_14770 [Chloroflexi bacterium]|nr:hypothetical protein [Chloroflexota bacterium]